MVKKGFVGCGGASCDSPLNGLQVFAPLTLHIILHTCIRGRKREAGCQRTEFMQREEEPGAQASKRELANVRDASTERIKMVKLFKVS
jgi:hypothetical protein